MVAFVQLQPTSIVCRGATLHFSSSGENQTSGGNTQADEILKSNCRLFLQAHLLESPWRRGWRVSAVWLTSSSGWERARILPAGSWLTTTIRTLWAIKESNIFFLLDLHKIIKRQIKKKNYPTNECTRAWLKSIICGQALKTPTMQLNAIISLLRMCESAALVSEVGFLQTW